MFFVFSNNFRSSSLISSLLLSTKITKSASSKVFILLLTPICSILSSVCLIPAVSITFSIIPSIFTIPSTISRVVPGVSVTMALSSSISLFRRLLFPTLGRPIIVVFIPSLIILLFSDSLSIL